MFELQCSRIIKTLERPRRRKTIHSNHEYAAQRLVYSDETCF